MNVSDCYFIWGEEEYLIDQEINKILFEVEQENGEEPEKISLDADELSTQELVQTIEFSPLFSTSRVVVIKKPYWLGKSGRKTKKMEEAWQVIKDYLNQTGTGQTLILTFPERNASNSLVKFLDKRAQVIPCKLPDSKFLTGWITDEFKQCRREINPAAVNLLARSGHNMYYLKNMIYKICLIVNNRTINEADISDQLNTKHEINIF
ncbi:MAG: DNA polymerase III subunit delta [Syntrophomonas sp.]